MSLQGVSGGWEWGASKVTCRDYWCQNRTDHNVELCHGVPRCRQLCDRGPTWTATFVRSPSPRSCIPRSHTPRHVAARRCHHVWRVWHTMTVGETRSSLTVTGPSCQSSCCKRIYHSCGSSPASGRRQPVGTRPWMQVTQQPRQQALGAKYCMRAIATICITANGLSRRGTWAGFPDASRVRQRAFTRCPQGLGARANAPLTCRMD